MRVLFRILFGLVLMGISCPVDTSAETFTVPLFPTVETGQNGDYLSARFDLGTAFSHIESATLSFVLPAGFEGGEAVTSNSSYFKSLVFLLHDGTAPNSNFGIGNSSTGFVQIAFHVPAAELTRVDFHAVTIDEPTWTAFLFQGQGNIAIMDYYLRHFHAGPNGPTTSLTNTWNPPAGIADVTLTVVGVPVPEACTAFLPLICCAFIGMNCRKAR